MHDASSYGLIGDARDAAPDALGHGRRLRRPSAGVSSRPSKGGATRSQGRRIMSARTTQEEYSAHELEGCP